VYTGIEFESIPGAIPVFHEVAACHAAGYRYFGDWQELSADEQAFLLAHFLTSQLLNNNQQDAQMRDVNRKTSAAK